MVDKIHFDLVSPEKLLLSDDVEMVTLPGTEGEFGVLAGHAPVISTLRPGVIHVQMDMNQPGMRLFVRGGFADVDPDEVLVLAEEASPLDEFDVAALEQRIKNSEEDLSIAKTDEERTRIAEELDQLRQLRSAL